MTTSRTYTAHGLLVRSDDIELDAPAAPSAASDPGGTASSEGSAPAVPDVTVHLEPPGPVPAYGVPLEGRILSHHDDGTRALSVARAPDGTHHTVCFHGLAAATIDADLAVVRVRLDPTADPALAPVLVSGTVMSVLLMLRGHPVLHASAVAVESDGSHRAIAFVGRSGMGKSTMATLLCRDGATLLSDDVLRSDLREDGGVDVFAGATALRLRPAAHDLGAQVVASMPSTADGRHSVAPPPGTGAPTRVRLGALVVPSPDREITAVTGELLQGIHKVLALAAFPRIVGWTDPDTAGAAHHHWGELARRVPVLALRVPWGPPFPDGLGQQAVSEIERLAQTLPS